MVRREIVQRKLALLHGYLEELEAYRDVPHEEYAKPTGPRRAVKRLIQLVVETAVDVNTHVVTELEGTPRHDYRSSFGAAAHHDLLPIDLAERLAPSARLNNIRVHEYGAVRDELVTPRFARRSTTSASTHVPCTDGSNGDSPTRLKFNDGRMQAPSTIRKSGLVMKRDGVRPVASRRS